jgi:hypothetical protein
VVVGSGYVLQFQNIAIVRGGHFAYVDISTDHRATFTTLKTFNWFLYPGWADGTADPADWVKFTFDLSPYAGDTVTIRLRLNTGTGLGADGWYLDSIAVGTGGDAAVNTFAVDSGWSMVAVPRALAQVSADSVYPGTLGRSYAYRGSYARTDTLVHGGGYWVKLDSARSYLLGGTVLLRDTFKVNAKWNMVGSISVPVDSALVKASPPGIVQSSYYAYTRDSGYVATRTLLPGKAYWVKVSQAGKLLPSIFYPAAAPAAEEKSVPRTEIGRLACTDARGRRAVLPVFAVLGAPSVDELPPPPPLGAFDVRFDTEQPAGSPGAGSQREFDLLVQSVAYPLRLEWSGSAEEGATCELVTSDGKRHPLAPGQAVTLESAQERVSVRIDAAQGGAVPAEFLLAQNYPNPFNPATTIRYQLPREVRVEISVYSALGEKVSTLADEVQPAGYRSVRWDAANAASGVYYCRLVAGTFQRTIPMLLLK